LFQADELSQKEIDGKLL